MAKRRDAPYRPGRRTDAWLKVKLREEPRTNEPAHWVRPEVVVQIRFNGWTEDGLLRQPRCVGFREDKPAKDVVREGGSPG